MKRVCRVERTLTLGERASVEVACAITGVGPDRADAATLLGWSRGIWVIENRLHDFRDVTMGEESSRVRSGSVPLALAALLNAAIGPMRLAGASSMAASRLNAARVRDLLVTLRVMKN